MWFVGQARFREPDNFGKDLAKTGRDRLIIVICATSEHPEIIDVSKGLGAAISLNDFYRTKFDILGPVVIGVVQAFKVAVSHA